MSTIRSRDSEPPKVIYWAPGAGPKQLYTALKGVRSALKTSWMARSHVWNQEHGHPSTPFRAWKGIVTWVPIDPETGEVILDPITDGAGAINHMVRSLDLAGHGFESGLPITRMSPDQKLVNFHNHDHDDPESRVLAHTHRS